MYTRNSDIRFGDGDSHRNIDTMFRATSTTKHKETIIAIVVLWSVRWMSSHRTFDPFKMKLPFSMSRTGHIAGGAKDFQLNSLEK